MAAGFGGGVIYTSTDGINWTLRFSGPGEGAFDSPIWIPELSMFITIRFSGINYSFNGVDWSVLLVGDLYNSSIAWSPELSMFAIGVRTSSAIYTSTPALSASLNTIKAPSSQLYLYPSNGFLGINNSSPSYQLDVIGNVYLGGTLNVGTKNITPNTGDITSQITFSGANNQAVPANVTDLVFINGNTRSFKIQMSIVVIATTSLYTQFDINGVQTASDWYISQGYVGDDCSVIFSITSGGQIQYTSANYTGFISLTMKFIAQTINI